jgi:hypothetical protein
MTCKKTVLTVLTSLILTTVLIMPAEATFPGKNGRIAFVQGPDIYTMNQDGSDVRQLTIFTDDNPAFWENWSPDGKLLVFSRFPGPDFFGQLWLMNVYSRGTFFFLISFRIRFVELVFDQAINRL